MLKRWSFRPDTSTARLTRLRGNQGCQTYLHRSNRADEVGGGSPPWDSRSAKTRLLAIEIPTLLMISNVERLSIIFIGRPEILTKFSAPDGFERAASGPVEPRETRSVRLLYWRFFCVYFDISPKGAPGSGPSCEGELRPLTARRRRAKIRSGRCPIKALYKMTISSKNPFRWLSSVSSSRVTMLTGWAQAALSCPVVFSRDRSRHPQ
jgi:hypothetical protein